MFAELRRQYDKREKKERGLAVWPRMLCAKDHLRESMQLWDRNSTNTRSHTFLMNAAVFALLAAAKIEAEFKERK
jgi:hypothetical protein